MIESLPKNPTNDVSSVPEDEGGLRAPPGLSYWGKVWWWFDFLILVNLARLRFIGILAVIGLVITQWDTLVAYYEKWTRPASQTAMAASNIEWFCPMHPTIVRDNDKEKCPICFMPLSRRKKGETSEEILPAGVVNRVQLSPYRIALAGVQTWEVVPLTLTKELNAIGYIEFNERGLKNVSARVKGRLDELLVNETGQMVAANDILASMYSPDLNVTVQNLLDAKQRNSAEQLASARQRLNLLGIGKDQIDEILQSGTANSHLRIRSPISGHVIKKYVREGQYVEEGTPLYDVADLSSIWIQAQIFEDDMAFLPVEQAHKSSNEDASSLSVIATTRAFPGETFQGKLDLIYPHVDQQSRTVAVRFELSNPGHKLRPGMTANVTLLVPPSRVPVLSKAAALQPGGSELLAQGRVLALPESAVIDTGNQQIVYRQSLPGIYEGVLVVLGPKMIGPDNVIYYPLISGLEAGERVVTSGSFLVDAETRLNPSASSIYFGGSGGGSTAGSNVMTMRPSTPEDEEDKLLSALRKLSPDDRQLAVRQKYCPILENSLLGSMGLPIKMTLEGETFFLCCPSCEEAAKKNPAATLQKIKRLKTESSKSIPGSSGPSSMSMPSTPEVDPEIQAAFAKLSDTDRQLAEAQEYCPIISDSRLGSMGAPIKLTINGKAIFVCCPGCVKSAQANPEKTLHKVEELKKQSAAKRVTTPISSEPDPDIRMALNQLSDIDQQLAIAQRFCPVKKGSRLGSMGVPVKVMIDGQPVFLCCEFCREEAFKDPQEILNRVKQLQQQTAAEHTP
jgi:Cu(I)/Ag(I) efflux system membrane fusion protein